MKDPQAARADYEDAVQRSGPSSPEAKRAYRRYEKALRHSNKRFLARLRARR